MKHKLFFNKLWLRVGMIVAIMTTALAGTVKADEVVAYTLTPTTNNATASTAYNQAYDFEINNITWNVTGNTGLTPWRIGGKKSTIDSSTGTADRLIYSKGTINENISKIVITHGNSTSDITVNSMTLIVSTAANGGGTVISSLSGTYTNDTTTTFVRPNNADWTGRYYKIVYNVTNTTTTQKYLLFSSAVFYKETGTTLEESDLSLSSTSLSFDLYDDNSPKTITCNTSSTGAITVSPSEYVTTSVSGNTITVTPVKATPSPQTITVNQDADATYAAGEATFTVSIVNSTPTYTVTYKANGGTGDDIEVEYYEGDDVTVAACSFTRGGYAFTKWNTVAGGTGTDYLPDATIENITANIDLYAQWEESNEVVDVINHDFAGITTSSYTEWDSKTGTSGAVYAGQSAGGDSNSGDCVQLRSNNNNSGIITTTSGGLAKKVSVTWNSQTANGRTLNVYGKSSAYSAVSDLHGDNAGTLIGTIVRGTSTELIVNDDYEFIGLRSASGAMYLNEIRITWEPVSTTTVATPEISGTESFYPSTEVTITCATADATIQYSIDGGSTWTNYSEPFTLNATTTVKAKATKSGMDDSEVATKTFTKVTPMTVAQARAAIDANTTVSNAYVSGIVSQVDQYLSNYHSITYWISDDGTTTNQLEVYSGKGLNGADFNSIDDIQVGDVVVVKGELKKHNEDYEFNYNNELVSITTKADPDLAFATTEYTVAPGAEFTTPSLTNPNNLTVTYSSSDDNLAVVDENTGEVLIGDEEGTVTITASFAGDATYRAGSASYTISIVDNTKGTIDNPYTVADVIAGKVTRKNVYVIGYIVGEFRGSNQAPYTSGFTTDANIALADEFTTSPTAALSIPVALPSDSLKTAWGCKTNDGSTIGTKVIVCGNGETYFSVNGIKSTSSVTAVQSVTVSSAGYATYCSENALDFTDTDIKAYVGTKNGDKLTFTSIKQVPANTGLLLVYEGGKTEDVPVIASATPVESNCLVGVNEETTISSNDYILNKVNDGVGFYKAGSWTTLGAHKAYIPAAVGGNVKGFTIDFDDDATGISDLKDSKDLNDSKVIYNLAGQRISKMQRGINIVNGKKILK